LLNYMKENIFLVNILIATTVLMIIAVIWTTKKKIKKNKEY